MPYRPEYVGSEVHVLKGTPQKHKYKMQNRLKGKNMPNVAPRWLVVRTAVGAFRGVRWVYAISAPTKARTADLGKAAVSAGAVQVGVTYFLVLWLTAVFLSTN
jgi:hypothetical protein